MRVFTNTTKGKVMGAMLALAVLGAIAGVVAFIVAGNTSSAITACGMVFSILTLGYGTAGYLREQEWKAKAAARRREYWNNIAA
jgi:FtsH-binding integral membrane protein